MTGKRRSPWQYVAVGIAISVALLSSFSIMWPGYLADTYPQPRLFEQGDIGTDRHVTFQLVDHEVVEADSDKGRELGVNDGTEAVIVTLHVDATEASKNTAGCTFELVAPGPSGTQHWGSDQLEVSLPYGDDSYEDYCILGDKNAFNLKQVFVVPEGAAKNVSLQFRRSSLEPPLLQWDW